MTPNDLDLDARRRELGALTQAQAAGRDRREALERADAELDTIVDLVRSRRLNISQAAKASGVSRTAIYRRLGAGTNGST